MTGIREWDRPYTDAFAASARAFADPKAERITRALGLEGHETILDVGAGTGHLTAAFQRRGHQVTALDATADMLGRNPASRRVRADAAQLPFADAAFDLVLESNLLHHVSDPIEVLREMSRVSRGAVAVVEPNRNHPPMLLFTLLVPDEWKALRFTRTHLQRLGAKAGMTPLLLEATGWVYQNKAPPLLACRLGRYNASCALAAYLVGVFSPTKRSSVSKA